MKEESNISAINSQASIISETEIVELDALGIRVMDGPDEEVKKKLKGCYWSRIVSLATW